MSKIARLGAALLLGCALVAGQGQASAASGHAVASAAVGSVDMTVDGQSVQAAPIAACDVAGTPDNRTLGVEVGRTTSYGMSETHCARAADGTASADASGTRFETTVLARYGGPVIEVRTFGARCETTGNGSRSYISLGGVRGITVPESIPANYTITIAGAQPDDPPMARIVLNELVAPTPPDGSLTAHTMHIELFPEGGPASGDIIVGSASCDPFPG